PPQNFNLAPPLSIVGVREGDNLRLPAGSRQALRLKLSALGGSGRRWWFIDGKRPDREGRIQRGGVTVIGRR
ncbi:penicillin-binding protein 1C, partial [Pseudomonas syringae pv. actinidiae ICMP 19096]